MDLDEMIFTIDSLDGRKSPYDAIERGVPKDMGVYVWYEIGSVAPIYIGKATGRNGLRNRILGQHLNAKYLETRQERWTAEDERQASHGVLHNGRLAIEKSAFRKNLARKTGNSPGEQNVQFIHENCLLRTLAFPKHDAKEIASIESRLIKHYRPELNRSGLGKRS